MDDLRSIAKHMFMAAVERADPALAMRTALANAPIVNHGPGRTFVIAVGKAAVPMMRETLRILPQVDQALVVTNPENLSDIPGATVIAGAHPVPDAASAAAGKAVIALLKKAEADDRVIALVSGGGSALMIAPIKGLSLENKSQLNALLLGSGLEINDMNLIRQQLSDLKGGGFLKHAAPAPVMAYILSDVIGDDLRAIASGPTVSPIGTPKDAIALMKGAGIWDAAPQPVKDLLQRKQTDDPFATAENTLVGSNRHSLDAMLAATPSSYQTEIVSDHLVGDVGAAADYILQAAERAPLNRPIALIFGGETTVQLNGSGLGGRNQELALRVAHAAQDRLRGDWVFLSGGTDGRDGPTDSAGGLVDSQTVARVYAAGGDLSALLENNDSYAALALSNDHLMTGGTGTNVADVQVFLRSAVES